MASSECNPMKKYLKLKCPHYFFFLFASLGDTTKKRENIDPVNYSQSFFSFCSVVRSFSLSRVNIYIWCVIMLPITYRAIRMCTISDVKTEKKNDFFLLKLMCFAAAFS